MNVTLMDCTLRDGANVVGKGFSAEITDMVLDGLSGRRPKRSVSICTG